ncbi:MAG TPA: aminotransferase class I/II-fold pyridoxal phosphate-dependent enzyme [Saprospiraceae bacterium]|nr:methionine gamma-lyase [Saprospirales bacterium]HRQ30413.1 aminotransferase class I/II-fold pyridoxal phosphate-dependent enzyme [Saprospiraceae bacterium]
MTHKEHGFESRQVHAGSVKENFGSAVTPIYQTSTFSFTDVQQGANRFAGVEDGYIYTRIGNPTIADLEEAVANLENGFGGIATSSGMGAVNTVYLSLLGTGDHMVGTAALYGPSRGIMESLYKGLGIESSFIHTHEPENLRKAIKSNTKLIYIETPTNPTIEITDLKAVCAIAKEHGIPVCVDNTFCSPYLQRPLDLGADIVLHSITKFINGHADIVGGIVVAKSKELYTKLRSVMVNMGFNMDPHQAFMARRGLKTLSIRMDKAQQNAIEIARYLENHPKVERVLYPGLESHPQFELAKTQMDGPGAMMSIFLKGGLEEGKKLMEHLKLPLLAVSLGGVETLIQHPASMTHSKLSKEARESAGISDSLVRLSVGIEDIKDLLDDFDQALASI